MDRLIRFLSRRNIKIGLPLLTGVALLLYYKNVHPIPLRVINRSDFPEHEFFEPEVLTDFLSNASRKPLIPHIIHQTYKDENIPTQFVSYIKTFHKLNPTWKYYLWTDSSARKFIADRHPSFLPVWDNYKRNINRADALRYFVLYEFGGVYADIDVECFRPLDKVTTRYAAIFPPEPPEHCFRLHIPFLIGNAIMMSRPKHPFLKQLIDTISNYQPMADQIDTAGPCFVTTQFMIYNKFDTGDAYKQRKGSNSNSPYFFKGNLSEEDYNAVYVPNTRYFMHTLNYRGFDRQHYARFCEKNLKTDDLIYKRGCHEYWLRASEPYKNEFTFTEHHWYQTYYNPLTTFKHISNFVENYTIYR